jgi:hypothetical protein
MIRTVRAYYGIEVQLWHAVPVWTLPEHLQQIVLDTDRAMAAELVTVTDLEQWQALWAKCPKGREWLVARALAELATQNI